MATNYNLNKASSSNMDGVVEDFQILNKNTDAATNQDETEYLIKDWSKWFGYYKQIPELKKAIDMKAVWTIGKGYKADSFAKTYLDNVTGWGMDTFNTILKNMLVVRQICGDAFCEIIRDQKTGKLTNLKPLDPGSMKTIVRSDGTIKRYEQINKISGKNEVIQKFEPSEIFHLTKDRVADEIHGTGVIEAMQGIIDANAENFKDVRKLMHRFVKPIFHFQLDTDEQSKVDAFVSKMDIITNKGENIYTPKDTVTADLISVPTAATLSPFQWREHLKDYFYKAVGIPEIIIGGGQAFSESSAKIAYLAFQQSVEDEQMDVESQVWEQLQLKIELEFPASLQNELISDNTKDQGSGDLGFQVNDITAGSGK